MTPGSVVTHLEPMFPITSFVPASECPHKGPLGRGTVFVCMCCDKSGQDHRPLPGLPIGSKLNADYEVETKPTTYVAPKSEPKTAQRLGFP